MVTAKQTPPEQEQPPESIAETPDEAADHEVITEPPPQWLIDLAEETFRKVDEAHRQIEELDRKYGRSHGGMVKMAYPIPHCTISVNPL